MNSQNEQTATHAKPRIYVASLADYNAGTQHGAWIEATQSAEHIREQIQKMLSKSREPIAEDWAIHDYENFGSLKLSEFASVDDISQAAKAIEEHGPIFAELMNYFGGMSDLKFATQLMTEAYLGAFDTIEDYVVHLLEHTHGVKLDALPSSVHNRIDYEGIARDLVLDSDIFTIECGKKMHVFRCYF